MFNKSAIFNRNEPIAKRDTAPSNATLSRQVIQTPGIGANKNASSIPSRSGNDSAPQAVTDPATNPSLSNNPGDAAVDKPMGARLIVGPDVKLKGAEILDCDTLVVEGRVEATMDSRVIWIAENGSFCGKVSIDIAEIHGAFEGELTARSQLIIHSTGRVKGTVRYGKLVADEGGELCGDISTLSVPAVSKDKAAPESCLELGVTVV